MHRSSKSRPGQATGFSLTEVVVALAIFAAVGAMAAVGFTRVRSYLGSREAYAASHETLAAITEAVDRTFRDRVTLPGAAYAGFYVDAVDPCSFYIYLRQLDSSGVSSYKQMEFATVCESAPSGGKLAGVDLTTMDRGGICGSTKCPSLPCAGGRLGVQLIDVGAGTAHDFTPLGKGVGHQALAAAICAVPPSVGVGVYPVTTGVVTVEVAAARLAANGTLTWDRAKLELPVGEDRGHDVELLK